MLINKIDLKGWELFLTPFAFLEKIMTKIKYETHPVTPERKAELREQGFTIVDARFDPNPEPKENPSKVVRKSKTRE